MNSDLRVGESDLLHTFRPDTLIGALIYLILIVPLVFCVIIVTSLIPDLLMTHADSNSASMHLFNPPPVWHNR